MVKDYHLQIRDVFAAVIWNWTLIGFVGFIER